MTKKNWTIAKLNLRNIKAAYFVTGLLVALMVSQIVVNVVLAVKGYNMENNTGVSLGWFLWMAVILAAILIPGRNFSRIVNLGGKRSSFFWGSLMTHTVLSGAASLVGTILYYSLDRMMFTSGKFGYMLSAPDVFGWAAHGPIAVILQQFAFLLLFATFVHTLSAAQGKWYGYAADIAIIAVISVFTPIAPLRAAEAWFFRLILFSQPLLQIPACLVLAMAVYKLNGPIMARKAI